MSGKPKKQRKSMYTLMGENGCYSNRSVALEANSYCALKDDHYESIEKLY